MRGYTNQRYNDLSDDETIPLRNGNARTAISTTASPRVKPRRLPSSSRERCVVLGSMIASGSALLLCAGALIWFILGPIASWHQQHESLSSSSSSTSAPAAALNWQEQQLLQVQRSFDEMGRYIVEDYDSHPAFSDFLPALTGMYGKPLYAFYVNRGQGIASFGVKSKNYPMLEFQPANKAYQTTALLGFRTFVQGYRASPNNGVNNQNSFLVEPFSPLSTQWESSSSSSSTSTTFSSMHFSSSALPLQQLQQQAYPKRTMYIGPNEMQIRQVDSVLGMETNVTYYMLPEEDFGAFVRKTQITNLHPRQTLTVSVLDGLARMEPFGGKLRKDLTNIGRTLEAWMGVYQPYNDTIRMPFYRLSTIPKDVALVQVNEAGHYCLAFLETTNTVRAATVGEDVTTMSAAAAGTPKLLPIIYDVNKVFGEDSLMLRPLELYSKSIGDIIQAPQYGLAKTASAFAAGTWVEEDVGISCVCIGESP